MNSLFLRNQKQRIFTSLLKDQRRLLSTEANYITSPIFYVNAKPHLGHFYSMTLADVNNRWNKFNERETFFTTGTDEHGLKVQNAAAKANMDPKLFCDALSDKFKELANIGNIEYDRFIRTTDPDHYNAVNYFWQVVWDKGYIYKGEHSGWYSISDEAFYPEVDIEKIRDEKTGEEKMVSKETGSEVTFEKEENYFFKLSAFQDQLIDVFENNPSFVQPSQYYNAIITDLKNNKLPDLSVSRPAWRLQWGITVPNDESQKIYVWFDALINYITSLGYPNLPTSELTSATHLVGKDITRFHCVHWPTFLMAADLPLPKRVIVHGHWLMSGRKMSKSRGNVADPIEIAEYYGVDALRLFMMRYSVLETDGDYSEEKLNSTRTEFIDKFCNLLIRSLSKNFSISRALERLQSNHVDELLQFANDPDLTADLKDLYIHIDRLHTEVDPYIDSFQMHKAIQSIWSVLPRINGLFDKYKPWTLKVKEEDSEVEAASKLLRQDLIIFSALDSLRCVLILLQSFIPDYSKLLLDRLNVKPNMRSYKQAKITSDLSYGENTVFQKGEKVPLQRLELKSDELK